MLISIFCHSQNGRSACKLRQKAWDLQIQISLTIFLLPHTDTVMVSSLPVSTLKVKMTSYVVLSLVLKKGKY